MFTPMLSSRTENLSSSLIRDILAVANQANMISFAGGLPATEFLPNFSFENLPISTHQYGASDGELNLREWVANYVSNLGISCHAKQVLITTGSQQGIDLITKLLIDDGSQVLVESPSYLAAIQAFKFFGAECLGLEVGNDGVDLNVLEHLLKTKNPTAIYLIPNFQNPSGNCYSIENRRAVAALLDKFNVCLIEDDPYRELVYDECCRQPICSFLQSASWIYLGSFSKIAAPGLRVGYLVAHPDLYQYLLRIKQCSDLHSNRLGQYLLNEWVRDSHFPIYLSKLCDYYKSQRNLMQSNLELYFSELADWQIPYGGLFFWLRLKAHALNPMDILPIALSENIAFMPGTPFFANQDQVYSSVRLNFSHANASQMQEGLQRLSKLFYR